MRGVFMRETAAPASLAGEAYEFVKQRILRGHLPLGQVISRRKIAAELGMSFLPVSEALLRLEFEGLLESRPRAGTRVRIPSREDVPPRRHQLLAEVLITGKSEEAAEAMREHVKRGMQNTMSRLKPYFRIRKAYGKTYFRSEKRQNQQLIDPSALN